MDITPESSAPLAPVAPVLMPPVRALAYALCATPGEYLAQCDPATATLIRRRVQEARIPAEVQGALVDYPDPLYLIALVGAGLPDLPALLPLWMRLAQAMPRAELRVVDDDALPLLDRLLSEEDDVDLETLDLPALLVLDDEWRYQARWGPRPAAAEPLLDGWLADNPDYEALAESDNPTAQGDWAALNARLMLQMRVWYNSGLDEACARELWALLAALLDENDAGEAV